MKSATVSLSQGQGNFIHVGLVGYGYWGSKHARVLSSLPNVALTVIDSRPDRLHEAQNSFPAANLAQSLEVAEGLDAAVIATPPGSHAAVALRALRSGLHTLVEKPLATSVADAEAVVEAAAASGVTLMVGHTFEYNAAVLKLKQIVSSGELGRILYIDSARLNLGRYQDDCNVIWDLAPHDLSIASYLLDESPETVSVWAQRSVGGVREDIAYLRVNFPSAAAFIHLSWLDPNKVRRVTIVGDKKMAVYDDLSDTDRIRIFDQRVTLANIGDGPAPPMPITYRAGDITSPYVEFEEPLMVQDSHFLECIRTGHTPRTSGERGLGIVRALAATDRALVTGGEVRVQGQWLGGGQGTVVTSEVAS